MEGGKSGQQSHRELINRIKRLRDLDVAIIKAPKEPIIEIEDEPADEEVNQDAVKKIKVEDFVTETVSVANDCVESSKPIDAESVRLPDENKEESVLNGMVTCEKCKKRVSSDFLRRHQFTKRCQQVYEIYQNLHEEEKLELAKMKNSPLQEPQRVQKPPNIHQKNIPFRFTPKFRRNITVRRFKASPMCPLCMGINIPDFHNHLAKYHGNLLRNPRLRTLCLRCEGSVRIGDINNHIESELCRGRRTCYRCAKKIEIISCNDLQEHMRTVHSLATCKICTLISASQEQIDLHWKIKHENRKVCILCPVGTNVTQMQQHEQVFHAFDLKHPEMSKKCSFCSKRFLAKKLSAHKASCPRLKDLEEGKFVCTVCQIKFLDESEGIAHATVHQKLVSVGNK